MVARLAPAIPFLVRPVVGAVREPPGLSFFAFCVTCASVHVCVGAVREPPFASVFVRAHSLRTEGGACAHMFFFAALRPCVSQDVSSTFAGTLVLLYLWPTACSSQSRRASRPRAAYRASASYGYVPFPQFFPSYLPCFRRQEKRARQGPTEEASRKRGPATLRIGFEGERSIAKFIVPPLLTR